MAARAQSRQAASKAQQTLASTSAEIASILKLSILHESDLVVSAESFVGANPGTTNAQFRHWADSERARRRYPELFGIAYTQVVPSTGLAAFATAAMRDPSGPLAAGGKFNVLPPGHRPFYCLQRASWYRGGAVASAYPAGYDFCSDRPVAATLFASRDSGIDSYDPIRVGHQTELGVQAAVYRGGLTPTTTRARRAAFVGGVGLAVLPQALWAALAGHPHLGVTFSFRGPGADVSFVGGHAPIHGQAVLTSLHNGWILRTVGPRGATGVFHSRLELARHSAGWHGAEPPDRGAGRRARDWALESGAVDRPENGRATASSAA